MITLVKKAILLAILVPAVFCITPQIASALTNAEFNELKRGCAKVGKRLGVHEDGSFACFTPRAIAATEGVKEMLKAEDVIKAQQLSKPTVKIHQATKPSIKAQPTKR